MSKNKSEEDKVDKPHKNSNHAIGNFVIYGIWVLGRFWKFGKADADRTTKDGTPIRIHQQMAQLYRLGLDAFYRILEEMKNVTTKKAKEKENEYIKEYKRRNSKNPSGNP